MTATAARPRDASTNWPIVQISDIAEHCLGKMLDKHKNKGTPLPYLRNINVRWFEFDLSDLLEMRFEEHEVDRYQARKGDLVICEGGYPGRAAVWESDEPIYLQKALHRVRFHDPERAKWVLYWLYFKDLNGSLSASFSGTGIQHFTKSALGRFEIPLPPLDEQKRIVAVLDQAFAALDRARDNAEANLTDGRTLAERSVGEVFSSAEWGENALRSLSKIKYGHTEKAQTQPVGPKFLRITDIQEGRVDWATVPYCKATGAELQKYDLKNGDIVFARTGATTGKSFLISDPPQAVFASYLIRLRPDSSSIHPPFLYHYFQSDQYWNAVRAGMSGSAQGGFNASKLGEMKIPVPNLDRQKRIADILDTTASNTEALCTSYLY